MLSNLNYEKCIRGISMIICCIVVYPILLFAIVPFWIYQNFVLFFVKRTNPKISKMLPGVSRIITGKEPYSSPQMSLCPCYFFDEKIDLNHIMKTVNEKWIKSPHYPELKQRIVRKFGYYFWENVDNFRLENHIRYLYPKNPNKIVERSEIRGQELENVILNGFDKRYSPWELILIPNVFDPNNPEIRSAMYIHFNHCLMDAQSTLKLLEAAGTKPYQFPTAKSLVGKKENSSVAKNLISLMKLLELLITGPYHAIQLLVLNDKNTFLEQILSKSNRNKPEIPARSKEEPKRIKLERLTALRLKHKVGMSALITTIVTAGIIKFMRKKCYEGFSKLPKTFTVLMVSPLPGHPKNLVNRWSILGLKLNLNENEESIVTLRRIQDTFCNLGQSVVPAVNYIAFQVLALIPIFLHPKPSQLLTQTALISNFPSSKTYVDFCGYRKVDWNAFGNTVPVTGINVLPQNYVDKFWIETASTKVLFQNQDDIQLMEKCYAEVMNDLSAD